LIYVENVEKTLAFYQDAFGFEMIYINSNKSFCKMIKDEYKIGIVDISKENLIENDCKENYKDKKHLMLRMEL